MIVYRINLINDHGYSALIFIIFEQELLKKTMQQSISLMAGMRSIEL